VISSPPPDYDGHLPRALAPIPVQNELVTSYALRVDASIGAPAGHLWKLAKARCHQRAADAPSRVPVTEESVERATAELCTELVGSRSADLILLGSAPKLVWHACLQCSNGAVAAVDPHQARFICALHSRWTGPTVTHGLNRLGLLVAPAKGQSHPVDDSVAAAAPRIHASEVSNATIWEALRRSSSAHRRRWNAAPRPEDLPTAAAIIEVISDPAIVASVCDPLQTYKDAYVQVAVRMEEAGNAAGSGGIDQAWLMLRWVAAAARFRWLKEWNTEDPAPLVKPLHVQRELIGPLEPFHRYLECLQTKRTDEGWWTDRFQSAESASRFLCPEGHIERRDRDKPRRSDRNGYACALCSGKRVMTGYNTLADLMPRFAIEWDGSAEGTQTPWTVGPGSNYMGYWLCPDGHPSYQATFFNRALNGSGCPVCASRRVEPGINDLATTHPHLAHLWDPNADNERPLNQIAGGNGTDRIAWRCLNGHSFIRLPADLVKTSGRCPVCHRRTVTDGVNDLSTLRPTVAEQWHPHRNGALKPSQVGLYSRLLVWWRCSKGHEFQQRVDNRCSHQASLCPVESGRIFVQGVNDLATIEPELVKDWDAYRNVVAPDEVVPGSHKRWWTCGQGHTQHRSVACRRQSGGCTRCPRPMRVMFLT
jgi:hypothetical protein